MPETNGNQDNLSRLDRIEIAIEHVINEHEKLVDEQGRLLKAQVVMVDSLDKLTAKLAAVDERLGHRINEIGGKLDALINVVDRDHREFHERLMRLESRQ
ncbi:MAG TPA: hypothetical protein VHY84_15285 [Bryobacteraceae bacterium]|jgi:ABC-type transporter Mla subunit MlaD|nr:hypothetical protein [Bryobacteraceae bacterium]